MHVCVVISIPERFMCHLFLLAHSSISTPWSWLRNAVSRDARLINLFVDEDLCELQSTSEHSQPYLMEKQVAPNLHNLYIVIQCLKGTIHFLTTKVVHKLKFGPQTYIILHL